jgi:glycosyltransferase involved in cell wall biosynthesis
VERGREAQYVIAGRGSDEQRLRRLTASLGIQHCVTFLKDADHRAILYALDMLVMPSLHEGLGMVILDAMACRRPVIATGVGGVYTLIKDGETGVLVRPKDAAAIADSIETLLDNPGLTQQIVDRAYEVVQSEFSAEHLAGRTLGFYREILADSERSSPVPDASG